MLKIETPVEFELLKLKVTGATSGSDFVEVEVEVRTEATPDIQQQLEIEPVVTSLIEQSRTRQAEGGDEVAKAKDVQEYRMKSRAWGSGDLRFTRGDLAATVGNCEVKGAPTIKVSEMKATLTVRFAGRSSASKDMPGLSRMVGIPEVMLQTGLWQLPLIREPDTVPGEEPELDADGNPVPKFAETGEDLARQRALFDQRDEERAARHGRADAEHVAPALARAAKMRAKLDEGGDERA